MIDWLDVVFFVVVRFQDSIVTAGIPGIACLSAAGCWLFQFIAARFPFSIEMHDEGSCTLIVIQPHTTTSFTALILSVASHQEQRQ